MQIKTILTLVVTAQCNLRCTYCYQTAKTNLRMDRETLRAAIDLAFSRCGTEIRLLFIGGEPLLAWELVREGVEHASSHVPAGTALQYEISTNGLLVTDEIGRFLDRHQFEVQLSFDGTAPAQHYRQPGSFDVLDRLLNSLRHKTPDLFRSHLRVSAIQLPATVPNLSDSIRYFMTKGIREIRLFPALQARPEWGQKDIAVLDREFGRVYADSLRHLRETGTVPVALFRKSGGDHHLPQACSAITGNNLVVDVDGRVYGCVLFAESYRELRSGLLSRALAPLGMGDFRDPEFRERHSEYVANIARSELFAGRDERYSSYGKCTGCEYRDACTVCPVSIGCDPANSDPHRVPDFICAYNRVVLKYRAMFPSRPDPAALLIPKESP